MRISKPFVKGYNPMTVEGDVTKMEMDFGVYCLDKGEEITSNEAKECVFVLMTGKVQFDFCGKSEVVERENCFYDKPILLHVPQNTPVTIKVLSDECEIAVQKTVNTKTFEPKLYLGDDCLCPNEERGAGTLNECSTRIVRTFFDRSTVPETNFFIGEVVSYPGKWSSFPPHTHVEPEIYYYKFLPENGYGYAEVGEDVYKVKHNDLTCMADGKTHSQATAPGYAQYYIWVIRLQDNADIVTTVIDEHAWTTSKDAKFFPEK